MVILLVAVRCTLSRIISVSRMIYIKITIDGKVMTD